MSNLEPIIPNIILEENDTLVHINLTIVISKGKIIIISTVVDLASLKNATENVLLEIVMRHSAMLMLR